MAPEEVYTAVDPCADIADETRQVYCGMIYLLDQQVGALVTALGNCGRLKSTVLFFSSDNGGAPNNGASNYPLRGSKGDLFDGGAKQVGFVYGGENTGFAASMRGATWGGMAHLADLSATMYYLGSRGASWSSSSDSGSKDGVNLWDAINSNADSPRSNLPIWVGDGYGAIRMTFDGVDYKLLLGVGATGWYALDGDGAYYETEAGECGDIFSGGGRRRSLGRRSVPAPLPSEPGLGSRREVWNVSYVRQHLDRGTLGGLIRQLHSGTLDQHLVPTAQSKYTRRGIPAVPPKTGAERADKDEHRAGAGDGQRARRGGGGDCSMLFAVSSDAGEETDLLYGSSSGDYYQQIAYTMASTLADHYQYAQDATEYADGDDDYNGYGSAEDFAAAVGFWGPWQKNVGYRRTRV